MTTCSEPATVEVTATILVRVSHARPDVADVVATTGKLLARLLHGQAREVGATAPDHWAPRPATFTLGKVTGPRPPLATINAGALVCPHCAARDAIVEVDSCTRDNAVDLEDATDGGHVLCVSLEDSNFETDRYECRACRQEVDLPLPVDVYC